MRAGKKLLGNCASVGSTADSAIFNPETNEAYSAQIDGTLTIIKETSPTSFAKEQTVPNEGECQTDGVGQQYKPDPADRCGFSTSNQAAKGGSGRYGRGMVADSFSILVVTK